MVRLNQFKMWLAQKLVWVIICSKDLRQVNSWLVTNRMLPNYRIDFTTIFRPPNH
jgi:hypothetical protein